MQNKEQSTIYGECTRDYVYIDDIVNVTIDAVINGTENDLYEVGLGKGIQTKDLYDMIKELMESDIEAIIESMRNGDIQASIALFIPPEYKFIELEEGLKNEINTISKLGS
jgi:UDP-glucose 4-epimerase